VVLFRGVELRRGTRRRKKRKKKKYHHHHHGHLVEKRE